MNTEKSKYMKERCIIRGAAHSRETVISICLFFFFFFFGFLGLHLQYMEVLRLGVKLELQLPVYTTAIVTQYPSCVCDLHHSSQQCLIFNTLRKASDRTCILMDPSWICYHWATKGTPHSCTLYAHGTKEAKPSGTKEAKPLVLKLSFREGSRDNLNFCHQLIW